MSLLIYGFGYVEMWCHWDIGLDMSKCGILMIYLFGYVEIWNHYGMITLIVTRLAILISI